MPDQIPEKHFPLQNLELERTDFYTFEGNKSKPLLLFGLRGPGGMNCLWPVVDLLTREGHPIDLLIDSAAKRILETKDHQFVKQPSESPLKRIMELQPKVAVTEFSAGAGVALPITWTEQTYHVPTVWVEDFPGQPSSYDPQSLKINPDYLCVTNQFTKEIHRKLRPTMDPEKIIVTGHPDFDKYATIDASAIRAKTREKLAVAKDDFLVVYSGQLPPETPDILAHVVEALNQITTDQKLTFLFSRHPRDITPQDVYDQILSKLKAKIVEQESISSDDIGFACDLLVTMTSTEGLKSAYRRVPSVHILPQELVGEIRGEQIPLPVRTGASLGVFSYLDLKEALEKSISNQAFRQAQIAKMQENFQTDGKAAKRVAEVIKRCMN